MDPAVVVVNLRARTGLEQVDSYEGEAPAPPAGDDALVARISLRLPEGLKLAIEAAATREGISVNAWLVRSLARAVGSSGGARRSSGNRLTGFGRS